MEIRNIRLNVGLIIYRRYVVVIFGEHCLIKVLQLTKTFLKIVLELRSLSNKITGGGDFLFSLHVRIKMSIIVNEQHLLN